MSVDTIHCPRCRSTLLRSDSEGLFHTPIPPTCTACGMVNPLKEAIVDPEAFVSFMPPGPTMWHSDVLPDRTAD